MYFIFLLLYCYTKEDFSKTRFCYELAYRCYCNDCTNRFNSDDDFSYRSKNDGFDDDEFENWWRELNNEVMKDPSRDIHARNILNVTEKFSKSDTKKAYKFPVKKFYPGKCKGKKRKEAEQKFIEIQEAEIQASLRYKNMKSYLVVENKLYGRINKFNSYINTWTANLLRGYKDVTYSFIKAYGILSGKIK